MENQRTITLHWRRNDGRRERTKLNDHTLADARRLVEWVFERSGNLYNEVDICGDDGRVETVQNKNVTVLVGKG